MLTKKDLIEAVKDAQATTIADAAVAVNTVLEEITKALSEGEKVSISDFGIFQITERAARKGINPMTKEEIDIPASKVVKFKSAKKLKEQIQ
ncbi:HU family DNA-binding protein [Faecalicoccus pleomorphus]|uniref:HU family DNA-binding protein n=1 Tax=Faecalicoccus pleomorphus TaxID=1323 RepID=UPI00195FBA84|nr:HU family DNA-binding protein [Faecalicoccus pleomorphus]MBM6765762.1 HU family DNA-binding protein [Faecalicoccus pleomorphus]MDM8292001.1 HU family DNA-binding protein [Faecalicoccus pleomorphus]